MVSGPNRFILHVPFRLAPGRIISNLDPKVSREIYGLNLEFKSIGNHYVLKVRSFDSDELAREFFPKIESGLLWLALKNTTGVEYPRTFSEIHYPTHAKTETARKKTDSEGGYNTKELLVLPESKRLI